ncbi:hypothetical protein HKX48_001386 [Thoreauomyces humboldtii]|nr:hypothetical protein HKX48_001386 [Thoreauomyces humboldtii]
MSLVSLMEKRASSPFRCHLTPFYPISAASLYVLPPTSNAGSREIDWQEAAAFVSRSIASSGGYSDLLPPSPALLLTQQEPSRLGDEKQLKVDLLAVSAGNLWIVVEDYPEGNTLLEEGPSYHIVGKEQSGAQLLRFGSLAADSIAEQDESSWPIVVSGAKSNVGSGPASRVSLNGKAVKASWAEETPNTIKTTVGEIAKTTFVDMEEHAVEKFGKAASVFQSARDEDAQLLAELEFASSLVEALNVQQSVGHKEPTANPAFMSFTFSGLKNVRTRYGDQSEHYKTGSELTAAAVKQMTAAFFEAHGGNVLMEVLTVPPSTTAALLRRASSSSSTTVCPTSAAACATAFSNCTNHGACTNQTITDGRSCFLCTCSTQRTDDSGAPLAGYSGPVLWGGDSCQYEDVSVPFHIMFWTSIALIVTTILVVSLLNNIGANEGGSDGAGSGMRSKTD